MLPQAVTIEWRTELGATLVFGLNSTTDRSVYFHYLCVYQFATGPPTEPSSFPVWIRYADALLVRNSLPGQGQLILEAVEEVADGIVFRVRAKEPPRCPTCLESRVSYHSRYVRRMRDLP